MAMMILLLSPVPAPLESRYELTTSAVLHPRNFWTQRQLVFLSQIVEDVPDVDVVVVPVGGAGLIAGVSLAVKTLKPECKVRIPERQ